MLSCGCSSRANLQQVVEEADLGTDRQNACVRTALGAVVCGATAAACAWALVPLLPAAAPCSGGAATAAFAGAGGGGAVKARAATAAAVGVATAAVTVGIATLPRGGRCDPSSSSSINGHYNDVSSSENHQHEAEAFTVELGVVGGPSMRGTASAPEAFAIVRPQPDGEAPSSGKSYGATSS